MHFEIMLPKQLFCDRLRLITETVQFFCFGSRYRIIVAQYDTIRRDGDIVYLGLHALKNYLLVSLIYWRLEF